MNDAAHHDPHQFSTLQKDAQSAGMDIQYCEIGQYWRAQPLGYQKYLALLPDGPVADQAWWKINAEGCGDFDASQSTLQAKIALYQNFLQRFPNSPHAAEAQKQVDTNQQMLLGMQKPATTETQQAAQSAPK
jgi:outer membrane protein assembly factor BamD (BamD/ComL family)